MTQDIRREELVELLARIYEAEHKVQATRKEIERMLEPREVELNG